MAAYATVGTDGLEQEATPTKLDNLDGQLSPLRYQQGRRRLKRHCQTGNRTKMCRDPSGHFSHQVTRGTWQAWSHWLRHQIRRCLGIPPYSKTALAAGAVAVVMFPRNSGGLLTFGPNSHGVLRHEK